MDYIYSNWFDIVVVAIILITGFLSLTKGFVKDVLSVANFIISLIIAHFLTIGIMSLISGGNMSGMILRVGIESALFLVIMIIGSMFTSRIAFAISSFIPKQIDQSLGFSFGLIKSYLVLSLIFSIVIRIYGGINEIGLLGSLSDNKIIRKKSERIGPDFIANAQTYKILEFGSVFLDPITNWIFSNDALISGFGRNIGKNKDSKIEENEDVKNIRKIEDIYRGIYDSDASEKKSKKPENKGYDKKDIEKIDRLIDIIQSN